MQFVIVPSLDSAVECVGGAGRSSAGVSGGGGWGTDEGHCSHVVVAAALLYGATQKG